MEILRKEASNINRTIDTNNTSAPNQFEDNRLSDFSIQRISAEVETHNSSPLLQCVKKSNQTGLPDVLKSGIESLSGFSMDNVRVHYNSSKPATVQALAYTKGTDIHVAPGQERHLPHEAWHVAQQMAGRVSPTTTINGMAVNDNVELEHEADVMGEKALQRMTATDDISSSASDYTYVPNSTIQCYRKQDGFVLASPIIKEDPAPFAVKENEAATVYFHHYVNTPNELINQGLQVVGMQVIDGYNYKKLKQKELKKIPTENSCKEKRLGRRTDVVFEDNRKRSGIELYIAYTRLLKCREHVDFLYKICMNTKRLLSNPVEENISENTRNLNALLDILVFDSFVFLGTDIIEGLSALIHINSDLAKDTVDKIPIYRVLDVIAEDLLLRKSQIENEISLCEFRPWMGNACGDSARDRSYYHGTDGYLGCIIDKVGGISTGWTGHYGNKINVDKISPDLLFIEDAVGKASSSKESFNAHWFAHIYGNNESLTEENGTNQVIIRLNTKFNSLPLENRKSLSSIYYSENAEKIGEWVVCYRLDTYGSKNKASFYIYYNEEDAYLYGFFDKKEGKAVEDGLIDFSFQTICSAMDGMLVRHYLETDTSISSSINNIRGAMSADRNPIENVIKK